MKPSLHSYIPGTHEKTRSPPSFCHSPLPKPSYVSRRQERIQDNFQKCRVVGLGRVVWIFPPFPTENAFPKQSQVEAAPTESTVETGSACAKEMLSSLGLGSRRRAQSGPDLFGNLFPLSPAPPTPPQGADSLAHTPTALSEKPPTVTNSAWLWVENCRGQCWNGETIKRLLPCFPGPVCHEPSPGREARGLDWARAGQDQRKVGGFQRSLVSYLSAYVAPCPAPLQPRSEREAWRSADSDG